ncbi:hypothetical protein WN093_00745 [Gammaproteobacteria bacterium AS21]
MTVSILLYENAYILYINFSMLKVTKILTTKFVIISVVTGMILAYISAQGDYVVNCQV